MTLNGAPYEALVRQHFRSTLTYWEQVYSDTTVYGRIYQERAARAIGYLDCVDLACGAPVLDIGCGPGLITAALAQRGFTVSAVDTLAEMVERTRTLTRRSGLDSQVRAQVGDIDRLPFPDACFELVIVIGVSEWLVSLTRPLQEIARVLRPRGHLIISADNNWPLHQVLDPLFNPVMKPIKASIGKLLRSMRLRTLQPRFNAHSIAAFDDQLAKSDFEKIIGQTLGFGPFTFCNRRLLSDEAGWQLHLKLQRLADNGAPLLRSAGLVYLVLARKSRAFEAK